MELSHSECYAIATRADLLESECRCVQEQGVTWQGRLEIFRKSGYGLTGGSATDRRLIVSGMAKLEMQAENPCDFLY